MLPKKTGKAQTRNTCTCGQVTAAGLQGEGKPGAKDEYANDEGYKGESHRSVRADRREDGDFLLEV